MSRDEDHGGGTWGFANCVWSPTRKENGSKWPFWSKVVEIRQGDVVIHLKGAQPNARFVGYSIAESDGFETNKRPPKPGQWDFAPTFYRADLKDYVPFHTPVALSDVFASRAVELRAYFDVNKESQHPKNIFYVWQNEQWQCLNGAYLSEFDDELFSIIFPSLDNESNGVGKKLLTVETGVQIGILKSRLGQARFSAEIKNAYGQRCCFPGCDIDDSRFLVGSHIARWSDNEVLRGNLGNGLCLCLMHDKAFEIGIFTLDEKRRVFLSPREARSPTSITRSLLTSHGQEISSASVSPLDDALLEHWIRTDIDPL